MAAGQVQRSYPREECCFGSNLTLPEISTAVGSSQQLRRVGGMSPAAWRLICASLGSWDRCLCVLGCESLALLHVALAWRTALAGFKVLPKIKPTPGACGLRGQIWLVRAHVEQCEGKREECSVRKAPLEERMRM